MLGGPVPVVDSLPLMSGVLETCCFWFFGYVDSLRNIHGFFNSNENVINSFNSNENFCVVILGHTKMCTRGSPITQTDQKQKTGLSAACFISTHSCLNSTTACSVSNLSAKRMLMCVQSSTVYVDLEPVVTIMTSRPVASVKEKLKMGNFAKMVSKKQRVVGHWWPRCKTGPRITRD